MDNNFIANLQVTTDAEIEEVFSRLTDEQKLFIIASYLEKGILSQKIEYLFKSALASIKRDSTPEKRENRVVAFKLERVLNDIAGKPNARLKKPKSTFTPGPLPKKPQKR